VLFILFHLAFHRIFGWDVALNALSHTNKAIMLTYHYICILALSFMAYVSLFEPRTLLSSTIKYSVLGFGAAFFATRIATEFTLFGFSRMSLVILVMCAIPLVLFLLPMFSKTTSSN
jgi:hypothetical protein